jgi:hypothetical protein
VLFALKLNQNKELNMSSAMLLPLGLKSFLNQKIFALVCSPVSLSLSVSSIFLSPISLPLCLSLSPISLSLLSLPLSLLSLSLLTSHSGNKKLNMSFVAQLFNQCPGLVVAEEVLSTFDFASLELDDAGDSREERVFRMWINSLNIPEFYVNNLFEDLHDGVGILKLEDSVQPGVVNWKKYATSLSLSLTSLPLCLSVSLSVSLSLSLCLLESISTQLPNSRKLRIVTMLSTLAKRFISVWSTLVVWISSTRIRS